jgi:hypothetical protein
MGFKGDDLHCFTALPAHIHGIVIVTIFLKPGNQSTAHEAALPKKSNNN